MRRMNQNEENRKVLKGHPDIEKQMGIEKKDERNIAVGLITASNMIKKCSLEKSQYHTRGARNFLLDSI